MRTHEPLRLPMTASSPASAKRPRKPAADWHPADISAELRKRGLTWIDVGREAGYENPNSARQCTRASVPRAEAAVARLLGVPAHKIWPSRYDAQGRPLRGQYAVIFGARLAARNNADDTPAAA